MTQKEKKAVVNDPRFQKVQYDPVSTHYLLQYLHVTIFVVNLHTNYSALRGILSERIRLKLISASLQL